MAKLTETNKLHKVSQQSFSNIIACLMILTFFNSYHLPEKLLF